MGYLGIFSIGAGMNVVQNIDDNKQNRFTE
jgi:hypothetical protein